MEPYAWVSWHMAFILQNKLRQKGKQWPIGKCIVGLKYLKYKSKANEFINIECEMEMETSEGRSSLFYFTYKIFISMMTLGCIGVSSLTKYPIDLDIT